MIKKMSSSQTSAPTCRGQVGAITTLLQACLVDGFNPKTISTLTVTANVATVVTSTDHGYFVDDTILIAGANESVFNSDFTITEVVNTTTFKFAVTTTEVGATGTITCKIAPLGWENYYTTTNVKGFRPGAAASNRTYIIFNDTQAQYLIVSHYEGMVSPPTGTNLIGTNYLRKSMESNANTKSWILLGNDKVFYLFIDYWAAPYGFPTYTGNVFGNFNSYKQNDVWNYFTISNSTTGVPASYYDLNYFQNLYNSSALTGHYIGRRSHGYWIANQSFNKHISLNSNEYEIGNSSYPFPSLNFGITLMPVFVIETGFLRGKFPGMYVALEKERGAFKAISSFLDSNNKKYWSIQIYNTDRTGTVFFSSDPTDWV